MSYIDKGNTGRVEPSQLVAVPITLSRFHGRLVVTHHGEYGESSLTLSPEQEAEFWKQVEQVIDPDFKVRR